MSWVTNNEWLKADADHRVRWGELMRFVHHFRPFRNGLMLAAALALLSSAGAPLIPWLFRRAQAAVVSGNVRPLALSLIGFLGILLLEAGAVFFIRIIHARISTGLSRELTLQYYRKILNLAIEDFIAFRQRSNLFQRLIDAMAVTDQFTSMLIRGGRAVIVVLIVASVVGMISWPVLAVLAAGTVALFSYVVSRSRQLQTLRSTSLSINYPLVSTMIEIVGGLFTIKALAASIRVTDDIAQLATRKEAADLRERLAEVRASQGAQIIRSVTLVMATGTGFSLLMTGRLLISDVLSLYVLANLLLQPVSELADYYTAVSRLSANIGRYHEVLDLQEEAAESAAVLASRGLYPVTASTSPVAASADSRATPPAPARTVLITVGASLGSGAQQRPNETPAHAATAVAPNGRRVRAGHVRISELDFAYRGGDAILTGINLEVYPGEKVSIIGRSGVGKTTLMRLLLGFLQPQRGTIHVDGLDVSVLPDKNSYRRRFGVVGQQDVFFGISVRDNLMFGLDEAVSDERIQGALRMVNLWSDVERLSHGLATTYSADLFSGGQKQRLFIARALLRDPSIVILDEPTSALDFESEKQVMSALDRLVGDRTTLTIAHRLSTVQKSDRVILLDDGCIRASGTHRELHRSNEYYRALCDYNSFVI